MAQPSTWLARPSPPARLRPSSLSPSLRTIPTCQRLSSSFLSSSSAFRSSPPALSFLRSPPMASHPRRRPLMESGQSTASLPYFPHRLAYITPSRPRLLSPSSAHYRELPPPVRTPLPSANADAKATRSTAGPPRARRYSPFCVLALFCPATPSPARLFSLQFAAAVDDQPRSLLGCRVPL